jgi:hypothetical protein
VKRLIPAAVLLTLGLPLTALGIIAFVAGINSVLNNRSSLDLGMLLTSCLPYLGLGIVWTVSGLLYWEERWQAALLLTCVGILVAIPLILGATLGCGHG